MTELIRLQNSPAHTIYSLRVRDKYGDYGLVGLCVLSIEGEAWKIESMALSCRVMGRQLEEYIFNKIKYLASQERVKQIGICFKTTDRNAAMQKIISENNFDSVSDTEFAYKVLETEELITPEWLSVLHP